MTWFFQTARREASGHRGAGKVAPNLSIQGRAHMEDPWRARSPDTEPPARRTQGPQVPSGRPRRPHLMRPGARGNLASSGRAGLGDARAGVATPPPAPTEGGGGGAGALEGGEEARLGEAGRARESGSRGWLGTRARSCGGLAGREAVRGAAAVKAGGKKEGGGRRRTQSGPAGREARLDRTGHAGARGRGRLDHGARPPQRPQRRARSGGRAHGLERAAGDAQALPAPSVRTLLRPFLSRPFCLSPPASPRPGAHPVHLRRSGGRARSPRRPQRAGPGRGMALLDLALEGMAVFGFVLFLVLWLMHFIAIVYT